MRCTISHTVPLGGEKSPKQNRANFLRCVRLEGQLTRSKDKKLGSSQFGCI